MDRQITTRICAAIRSAFCIIAASIVIAAPSAAAANDNVMLLQEGLYCGEDTPQWDGDDGPLVTKRRLMSYPKHLLYQGTEGYAVVRPRIDESGAIETIEVLWDSADGSFGASLAKTLRRWRFAEERPGAYCIGISFQIVGRDGARRVDNAPAAPDPIRSDYKPALPPEPLAFECSADVLVVIGNSGVPVSTTIAGKGPPDTRCGRLASETVWHWRFPPDTPPGLYRAPVQIRRGQRTPT